MRRYILQRLVWTAAVVYFVISLSFFMIRIMPGSPMLALEEQLELQGGLSFQQIQARVQELYAITPKAPLWQQYVSYIWNALHVNLGQSISDPGKSVISIIASALPWTIFVVALAILISFIIGVAVGSFMATSGDRRTGKATTIVSSLLSAIPNYIVAIVLLYVLADVYHIFPIGGAYSAGDVPGLNLNFVGSALDHAVLPITAYVITSFGGWALAMKGSATPVLGEDYVRAAQARGLSPRRVRRSYVGRNSMLPMVTSLALSLGFMFGGSVFIETYFTYPGIGYYLIQAVNNRDYTLMMGCFILITISVVVSNMLVDLLYPLIDPRVARPSVSKGRAPARAVPQVGQPAAVETGAG